jgi:hypothetical protein
MTKNSKKKSTITLDGMMTIGKTKEGLKTADFVCSEYVDLEAFAGKCNVQIMRDGNMYITELAKKVRNSPIFREDNSSFSRGVNRQYYYILMMPDEQLEQIPDELVRQATAIAEKIRTILLNDEEDAE